MDGLGLGSADQLCRLGQVSCGACCHGSRLDRERLEAATLRNARLWAGATATSGWRLVWHELRARRGSDLGLAVLLRLPFLGAWIRRRWSGWIVCAFLALDREGRLGCLLHPSQHGGRDRRLWAFALLAGLGCGDADYQCAGTRQFQSFSDDQRERLRRAAEGLDWFEYERFVQALGDAAFEV